MSGDQYADVMAAIGTKSLSPGEIGRRAGIETARVRVILAVHLKHGRLRKNRVKQYYNPDLVENKAKPLLPDMWRGWRDPVTGYAPESLWRAAA